MQKIIKTLVKLIFKTVIENNFNGYKKFGQFYQLYYTTKTYDNRKEF